MNKKILRVKPVFRILEQTHPPTMLELLKDYTPFQMLVMTMLSARTRDATTIPIVKEMFNKYPSPEDFIRLRTEEIEKLIYRVGFHRVKARNLKKLSELIVAKHHSQVPETVEELTSLPGIGRKTANCLLNYAFHRPAIAVDVHVHRIANRLGWIKTRTAPQTESELMTIIPLDEWINVNKLFVGHGQTICRPINPQCKICPIWQYCDYGQRKLDRD